MRSGERFTCEALDEDDAFPRCTGCDCEDDNLDDGLCAECRDYSEPTAFELYRDERTWGL